MNLIIFKHKNYVWIFFDSFEIKVIVVGMPDPADYVNGIIFNPPNLQATRIIDEGNERLANLIAASVDLIKPSNVFFDFYVSRKNKRYIEKAIILAKTRMYEEQLKSFKWYISTLKDDASLNGALFLANLKIINSDLPSRFLY